MAVKSIDEWRNDQGGVGKPPSIYDFRRESSQQLRDEVESMAPGITSAVSPFGMQEAAKERFSVPVPMRTTIPSPMELMQDTQQTRFQPPAVSPSDQWVQDRLAQDREQASKTPVFRVINSLVEPLSELIYKAQAKTPGVAAFQEGAANSLGVQSFAPPVTGPSIINAPARLAGNIAGAAAGMQGVGIRPVADPLSIGRGAAQAAAQASPRMRGPIARRAIEGAVAGGVAGVADSAIRGDTDLRDIAAAGALGAGLGAAADVALPAIGSGLRSLAERMRRNQVPEEAVQELLALPAPRERGTPNGVITDDVITSADTTTTGGRVLGLPAPDMMPPTTARIAQQSNPYRDQFEQLIRTAREMQDEGRFTPGREAEELESLWTQMAGREDVGLDNLIQRAYPTRPNRIAPDLVQRARETQYNREVAGAPFPVRSVSDRYTPGPMSPAAAPITVPARAQAVTGPLRGTESRVARSSTTGPLLRAAEAPNSSSVPESMAIPPEPKQTTAKWQPPEPLNQDEIPFSISDDLDDIALPEADEVAPRIRDRLNTFADDMIANARAELAKGVNRLSSNPVDVWGQYAKLGAGYMLKGTVKLADFTEQLVRDLGEEIRPHARRIFKDAKEQYKVIQREIETEDLGLQGFEAQELKDLSNINLNTADVFRNFKKVFGQYYEPIKKSILDPFDESKGSYAREQKQMTDDLYNDIVKGLGIKKGSKESALVQRYGEGQIDLAKLQEETHDWEKIVEADRWFRNKYDDLLDRVNASIQRIYPNRPEKLVPKRKDYYRHFQDLGAWGGLKNLFDSASGKIGAHLSGLSPFTKPKQKWASFAQKRGLGDFENDAVGGFLEYIPAASYAIHIDPHISVFRNLAKRLASDTEQTGNINNFIEFLNNYANDLSGKTSMADRWVQFVGGRNTLRYATWLNNRVKTNMILGNVRSSLAQLANIPNGVAYGGQDAIPGAIKTLDSVFKPNEAMQKSRFMTERFLDKNFRRFNERWWEQPKRFAEATMELSDRIGTSFIWNTAYAKALRQKVADPVKFADEQTRRLVGGRGVGEQPLLLKSQMFNIIAPFQLEVNNLWRVMKDFVDEKQYGALLTLFISNFVLNKAFEVTTGSGVTFDPLDAIIDSVTEDDMSLLQRAGRVFGEGLSNIPLGSTIADIYPEYGAKVFGMDLPTRESFFGDNDPTRFGTGLAGVVGVDGIKDPLFKLLPPFGGAQVKKTIKGVDSLVRGGSYTDDFIKTGKTIEEPELRFPVDSSKTSDVIRAAVFGPFATSGGQRYTNERLSKLGTKQTEEFQRADDGQAYYDELIKLRKEKAEKDKKKEEAKKESR
ncbi:hypothetical protein RB620_04360 [Paenibacillus sp. LHD-117]|uniref:hypothetical protein n=1 Tax=Paenibacillus sp. LHD-117 TaxID=3071412 RepID=UPI0027DF53F2|nr:hypothetical protein [Paenibacillus sp. LHD-117]MDQ6418665.1 hypothetical protein [Paenibacillus sp. LHD-117]